MKLKTLFLLLAGIYLGGIAFGAEPKSLSNRTYLELKVGGMVPFSFPGGFVGGVTLGRTIDEIVSLNFGGDYFIVAPNLSSGGATNAWVAYSSVTNINYIHLFLVTLNFRIDMPFLELFKLITPYVQAGVAFDLMVNNYKSTSTGNNTYGFVGLGGLFEIGARLRLGSVTSLILATSLNVADVVNGTPVSGVESRVSATGFLFRLGLGFRF